MNVDALLQASGIVSHAGCPDGIGAAMICTAAYAFIGVKPPPTYFVQYGTKYHEDVAARPRQIFVDITPPKGRWEEWRGMSPIVLDHHETVEHIVHGLGGTYGGPDESGAMLAFEHVMVPLAGEKMSSDRLEAWKRFAHLCMTRDMWKSASPNWLEACALAHALLLRGQKWCVETAEMGAFPMDELLPVGRLMHEKIVRQAKGVIRSSMRYDVEIDGRSVRIAFFNHADGGTMSDIAHHVMDEMPCDAVIGYFYIVEDNVVKCVMSARTDGLLSASDLARSFGGGGHVKAAGFRIDGEQSPSSAINTVLRRIRELNPV